VLIVREEKAVVVAVTPGNKIGELTAITGAVKTGEKAIVKPAADSQAGTPVRVATK
jgi:hypothetical protein